MTEKKQTIVGRLSSLMLSGFFRLFLFLLLLLLLASLLKPETFLRAANFKSMAKQLTEYGLMSFGMTICLISGGIDLSVVYIANLSSIIAALFIIRMTPLCAAPAAAGIALAAALIALCVGAACGILNGALISYLHIPAMLATLGTTQLYLGLGVVITGGSTVSQIPGPITTVGNAAVFGVPLVFLVFCVCAVVMTLLMSKTRFGLRVYMIGTNDKAALFAGLRIKKILIQTYMLSGIIGAMAGLSTLSRMNSAKPDYGSSYTIQCILIAVLGGVDPNGGFGSMACVALAVIILQVLSSFLNMFPSISNFYRDLIWGATLILVMILNKTLEKRRSEKMRNA